MYIAQKTLKNMSSVTNEINEDTEDVDDLGFTPTPENVLSVLSPSMSGRQPSLVPPADENFTIDPPSEVSLEPQTNGITGMFSKNIFQAIVLFYFIQMLRKWNHHKHWKRHRLIMKYQFH